MYGDRQRRNSRTACHIYFEDSDRRIWIGGDHELFMVAHDKVNTMFEGITFYGVQELDDLYFIAGNRILVFDNLRKYFYLRFHLLLLHRCLRQYMLVHVY